MSEKNCRHCKHFSVESKGEYIVLDCPHKYQSAREFDEMNNDPKGTAKVSPVGFSWVFAEGMFESLAEECETYEDSGVFNKSYYTDGIDWIMKINPHKHAREQQREIEQFKESRRQHWLTYRQPL
ncbi:MAG: hypothetical protein RM338_10915 [Nostoc sp. DedQUE12a]|nr:hypothetical protein [Nostoc sp. DedQUE12a]